jgi:endonuclease/exonuclease/phosphatase family metal-dependent hydrolase
MRLVTFNILHGRTPEDDSVDLTRLVGAIRELDPDILALQEVDHLQERSTTADLTAVAAAAMRATEHRFVAAVSGTPGETWTAATGHEHPDTTGYGVALLSRYPVTRWNVVRLPRLMARVPMWFPGRWRPIWVSDEPRVAVVAEIESPQGPLTIANTHLSFLPGWNSHQIRLLLREVADRPRPLLITGDLNVGLNRARRATGFRSLAEAPTFPAWHPRVQLDHVLLDGGPPGFAAEARSWSVRTELSDHRALVVEW